MSSGSVWERSLTEFTLSLTEGFEMTNRLLSCHSERKRGIFLDLEPHSGLKMNDYPNMEFVHSTALNPQLMDTPVRVVFLDSFCSL
jgi:hypothetical protein